MSLDRQGSVFGRALSACSNGEKISAFILNANSAGGRKKVSALDTDMKKIKSMLVTIVTDNVLRVGIVSNKTLLGRMLQERAQRRIERGNEKRWAMRQE